MTHHDAMHQAVADAGPARGVSFHSMIAIGSRPLRAGRDARPSSARDQPRAGWWPGLILSRACSGELAMRPARIIAAVLLAAGVAATGSYLALSTAHQPAAAPTHPTTPPPTTPPTNPTPSPPACRTAQLELRAGQQEGAMGHVYSTYGFRN